VLDKKDPIQAMVVNVAEKSEQDFGRMIERGERCVRISPGRGDENVI
jgi:hypothetical protein